MLSAQFSGAEHALTRLVDGEGGGSAASSACVGATGESGKGAEASNH